MMAQADCTIKGEQLELQDRAQPFIDGALETCRKRTGMFCQEAAV